MKLRLTVLCCLCLTTSARPAEEGDVKTTVRGNTRAAAALFAQLREKEGNHFLSPYSISSALAMTYAGARGATATEMATALHFIPELERLMPAFGTLNRTINGDDKPRSYQLSVANALWGRKDYRFLPDFLKLTRDHFGANIEELDFQKTPEAARAHINRWVERQTNLRIKDLLPPGFIVPDTTLVLTNAIYFKGDWLVQFKKDQTKEDTFKLGAGGTLKTPFMNRTDESLACFETTDLQGVELPYKGKELSMVILLPRKEDGLAALEKQLSEEKLAEWLKLLRRREVKLSLPKFKMTVEYDLVPALKKMGIKKAFVPGGADLTGLSGASNLYISGVVHKAFVEVNEEGTEAAAATGVGIRATSVPPPPLVFRADRPFLFLIRDVRNDSVLFLGRLAKP